MNVAIEGLDPHIRSALSSHGPENLDEVRRLANRVESTTPVQNAEPVREDQLALIR